MTLILNQTLILIQTEKTVKAISQEVPMPTLPSTLPVMSTKPLKPTVYKA